MGQEDPIGGVSIFVSNVPILVHEEKGVAPAVKEIEGDLPRIGPVQGVEEDPSRGEDIEPYPLACGFVLFGHNGIEAQGVVVMVVHRLLAVVPGHHLAQAVIGHAGIGALHQPRGPIPLEAPLGALNEPTPFVVSVGRGGELVGSVVGEGVCAGGEVIGWVKGEGIIHLHRLVGSVVGVLKVCHLTMGDAVDPPTIGPLKGSVGNLAGTVYAHQVAVVVVREVDGGVAPAVRDAGEAPQLIVGVGDGEEAVGIAHRGQPSSIIVGGPKSHGRIPGLRDLSLFVVGKLHTVGTGQMAKVVIGVLKVQAAGKLSAGNPTGFVPGDILGLPVGIGDLLEVSPLIVGELPLMGKGILQAAQTPHGSVGEVPVIPFRVLDPAEEAQIVVLHIYAQKRLGYGRRKPPLIVGVVDLSAQGIGLFDNAVGVVIPGISGGMTLGVGYLLDPSQLIPDKLIPPPQRGSVRGDHSFVVVPPLLHLAQGISKTRQPFPGIVGHLIKMT